MRNCFETKYTCLIIFKYNIIQHSDIHQLVQQIVKKNLSQYLHFQINVHYIYHVPSNYPDPQPPDSIW